MTTGGIDKTTFREIWAETGVALRIALLASAFTGILGMALFYERPHMRRINTANVTPAPPPAAIAPVVAVPKPSAPNL